MASSAAPVSFTQESGSARAVLAEGSLASKIITDHLGRTDLLSLRSLSVCIKQLVQHISPANLTADMPYISDAKLLSAILSCAPNTRKIRVSYAAVTASVLDALCRVQSLSLKVDGDEVEATEGEGEGEEGARFTSIFAALAPNVVELGLRGCALDPTHAAQLVKIEKLTLDDCTSVDALLCALASHGPGAGSAAGPRVQTLHHLNLSDVDVTETGLESLELGSCAELPSLPPSAQQKLGKLRAHKRKDEKLLQNLLVPEGTADSAAALYPNLRTLELCDQDIVGALPPGLTTLLFTASTHKCPVLQKSWFSLCRDSIQEIDITYGDTYDSYGSFVASDYPSLTRLSLVETNTRSGMEGDSLEEMLHCEGKTRTLKYLFMDMRTMKTMYEAEHEGRQPDVAAFLGIPYLFVPLPKHWGADNLRSLLFWNRHPPAEHSDDADDDATSNTEACDDQDSEPEALGMKTGARPAGETGTGAESGQCQWIDTGYVGGPIMPAKGEPLRVLDVRGSTADLSDVLMLCEGVQYLNISDTSAKLEDVHPHAYLIRLTCTLKVSVQGTEAAGTGQGSGSAGGRRGTSSQRPGADDVSLGVTEDELVDYVSFTPTLRYLCLSNEISTWKKDRTEPARQAIEALYQRLCRELPDLTGRPVRVRMMQADQEGKDLVQTLEAIHPGLLRSDPELLESPTLIVIEWD